MSCPAQRKQFAIVLHECFLPHNFSKLLLEAFLLDSVLLSFLLELLLPFLLTQS